MQSADIINAKLNWVLKGQRIQFNLSSLDLNLNTIIQIKNLNVDWTGRSKILSRNFRSLWALKLQKA